MRIVLVNPTVRFKKVSWNILEKAEPVQAGTSYGLLSIAGVLQKDGHEVINIDPNIYDEWEEFIEIFTSNLQNTDVLGISSYSPTIILDEKIIQIARNIKPDIIIIAGGFCATFRSDIFVSKTDADIVIRGEGEVAASRVMSVLDKYKARHPLDLQLKNELVKIKGVRVRYLDGKEKYTEECEMALLTEDELNSLPYPLYKISPLEKYKQYWKANYVSLATSRGCDHNCPFCSISNCTDSRGIRKMREDVLFDHLKHIVTIIPDISYIFFCDPNFTFNNERTINICKKIVEYKEKNILQEKLYFGCESRVDSINATTLSYMQKAGFLQIWIGLESGSQYNLNAYNKRQTVDQNVKIINTAKQYDITIIGFFMIASPESKIEDIVATLELIVYLLECGGEVTPDVSYCLLSWEGTSQMRITRKNGWDFTFVLSEFIKTDLFTKEKIKNVVAEGGYIFPNDEIARYFIFRSYHNALSYGAINTSTFLTGIFLAFKELFNNLPRLREKWVGTVSGLYIRAVTVGKKKNQNRWMIPYKELINSDIDF